MPKVVGIPYFNAAEIGAVQAGKDLGINVIYTGPTTPDSAEQVRMLEDLISKGVDAICVAPNDPAALTPVLQRARNAGIKVLDWDTPADPSAVDISVHQIDDKQYGEHIWDLLVEGMGDSGDYAVLTGGLSAANLNAWIDAGLAYASTAYPNLHVVSDRIATDEKTQVAYQKSLDLITAYPNLKGILGITSTAPAGASQAVQEKGMTGKITVVGTALPSDSGPFLEDGSMYAVTLWDPGRLAYLAVFLANDLVKGQKPSDGQEIPNFGKIQVHADGKTVIMGPPTDFTKGNYKQFNF
jgi:simple sugar transport system substrate-binding protein/rhamnose transport system substrate-binding protein